MNSIQKARTFANNIATTIGSGNRDSRVLAPSIFQPPASGSAYIGQAYHWMQVLKYRFLGVYRL